MEAVGARARNVYDEVAEKTGATENKKAARALG